MTSFSPSTGSWTRRPPRPTLPALPTSIRWRPGFMFQDGSPLPPDAVVSTSTRIMDKATAATNAPRLADVDKVEADGNTIRFRLKQVNATLPYVLADNSSTIVSKKWIESG